MHTHNKWMKTKSSEDYFMSYLALSCHNKQYIIL